VRNDYSRAVLRKFPASRAITALLALLFAALAITLAAHDIPSDATVQMFLKPVGNHLNILVRVPLKTMRDVEFSERGQGYLDFDLVDPSLRETASLWVSDFIDVHEGETRSPKPRLDNVPNTFKLNVFRNIRVRI
jgi:hypothetical protein